MLWALWNLHLRDGSCIGAHASACTQCTRTHSRLINWMSFDYKLYTKHVLASDAHALPTVLCLAHGLEQASPRTSALPPSSTIPSALAIVRCCTFLSNPRLHRSRDHHLPNGHGSLRTCLPPPRRSTESHRPTQRQTAHADRPGQQARRCFLLANASGSGWCHLRAEGCFSM